MTPIELVRQLRAHADSTTFPAEAETFRAKASQLMARHGITEADLNPPAQPVRVVVVPAAWGNWSAMSATVVQGFIWNLRIHNV